MLEKAHDMFLSLLVNLLLVRQSPCVAICYTLSHFYRIPLWYSLKTEYLFSISYYLIPIFSVHHLVVSSNVYVFVGVILLYTYIIMYTYLSIWIYPSSPKSLRNKRGCMKEKLNSISRLLTFIFPLLFTAGLLVVAMVEGGGGRKSQRKTPISMIILFLYYDVQ